MSETTESGSRAEADEIAAQLKSIATNETLVTATKVIDLILQQRRPRRRKEVKTILKTVNLLAKLKADENGRIF